MPDQGRQRPARCAVVSGAGRGFGAALAGALADDGWVVYGIVRPDSGAARNAAVRYLEWDISRPCPGQVAEALAGADLDVVVNNAAVGSSQNSLAGVDPDHLAASLNNNVGGAVRVTQACLAGLAGPDSGRRRPLVINVSSRLGSVALQAAGEFAGFGTSYSYRLSKAALNMLTLCLHEEFGGRIDVWSVHPGLLKTGMGRSGAAKDPAVAAAELLRDINRGTPPGPRFVELGSGAALPW